MLPKPIVSVAWLAEHLQEPDVRVCDCRFALGDSGAGHGAYREGHVPGAVYLDLERDLSGPKVRSGQGGRHPLPEPFTLAKRLEALGIGDGHRVVVYDDPRGGNGMFAARAWWLLRWLGHDDVAVLDGGWPAWQESGGDVERSTVEHPRATFTARPHEEWLVRAEDVPSLPGTLLDSRAPARFRGDVEPIDKKAGHVPGAHNLDWATALDDRGRFRRADEQRERLGLVPDGPVTVYCGSGVSACVNLVALELSGRSLGKETRLYAGSWSDWVSDDARAVETGEQAPKRGSLSSEPGMTAS
ncbi:sulfurtransferase [Deinococcus yavapaiensis]|uniref:Thiosulfate/3-mercaptopyruvate sulfurtransferase n=1 Tax=Deinococcus yavapaiensis KR-236 TaxID=694435 RepID=A0A318S2V9_9DEIO|nr:sulfurtransferase [Deinococcus yavapaiensis]PYE51154.1 thiosulfate/3-mercaptopyruvate sulfurtransferase [Deinococcus yavapaiensis KR-236]